MSDIETKQEIEALVKQLSSRNIAEREAAEAAIRRLGPAAVQDLLAILAQEKIKRAQKRRGIGIAIACYFVFMITCIILTHNPALLASLGSMSGLMVAAFAATQTQRDVALVLTQLEDLRTVGALAEALEYLDQKLCSLAENALITLLPRLKASDAHLLDAQQRACLYRALKRKNSGLVIAILKSLEQIGDADALPHVQKRLNVHSLWYDVNSGVSAAARECLPHLQQLAAEQHTRQTLLRASAVTDAFSTASDALLRPAGSSDVAPDPQELLRAAVSIEHPMCEPLQSAPSIAARVSAIPQPEEISAENVLQAGQG